MFHTCPESHKHVTIVFPGPNIFATCKMQRCIIQSHTITVYINPLLANSLLCALLWVTEFTMGSLMDRTPPQSEDRWRLSNQKTIRSSLIRQFPSVYQTARESRSSAPFAVIPLTILSWWTITRSNEHIISPYKLVSHALLFLYHTWSCMQTNSWPLKGHPQLMG